MLKIKLYANQILLWVFACCFLLFLNQYFCISAKAEDHTLTRSEIENKYYRAVELVNQGYSQEAIALMQELLSLTSDTNLKARINLNLTITYLLRGDLHLARESYQFAQKYANDTLSTELITVEALMAFAAKDWERAIVLYSTLELENLTILNNLIESYQGRVKQRKKLALTARWEEDEEEEKYWLALASEDEMKAQQLREKALEIASQEISIDAAKVFLRELQTENTQELVREDFRRSSVARRFQRSPRENFQSPRENKQTANFSDSLTENTQELGRENIQELPRENFQSPRENKQTANFSESLTENTQELERENIQELPREKLEASPTENSHESARENFSESARENIQLPSTEGFQSQREKNQESPTENLSKLPREKNQESLMGKTVSVLQALKITEETILLMVEVAKINANYWTQTEEMAVKLNNPDIYASIWQAEAEYYYQQGNLAKALSLINQANFTFTEERLSDNFSLYWTRARIYAQQGLWRESRDNYQLALDKVANIRFDLASATRLNKEELLGQTSPLYKEYMAILLAHPTQANLAKVISILQLFHLAELETHFAYPCELTLSEVNDSVKPHSALIFNLVLEDSLHQIVRFADGLQHKVIPISRKEGKSLVLSFRQSLEFDGSNEFRPLAGKLYDLLIRDWREEFESRNINNLTFINNAYYRNIPMAVLWDGNSYLIENYGINYSLGLDLASASENLVNNPVIFASTKGSQWTPSTLPFVQEEVHKITSIMGGDSYLDEQFSPQQLSLKLQSREYGILHLAGHARFSSFENSQFQTGTEPMSLSQFETFLRKRLANLQLLVLSGCQTAAGNDLAILGIAGIGVRNGIDSVVGGLWFASDKTTAIFIEHFYQSLLVANPSQSLRNAQLELIKSPLWNHPRYWSNYILLH